MLALVYGRPLAIASLVVAGALVYPASGVVAGLALAIFLFLLPARDRGAAACVCWGLRRRLGVACRHGAARGARLASGHVAQSRATARSFAPGGARSTPKLDRAAGPSAPDDLPHGRGIGRELRSAIGKSISVDGPAAGARHARLDRTPRKRTMDRARRARGALGVGGGIVLARRRPEARRAADPDRRGVGGVSRRSTGLSVPLLSRALSRLPAADRSGRPAAGSHPRAGRGSGPRAMGGSWLPVACPRVCSVFLWC